MLCQSHVLGFRLVFNAYWHCKRHATAKGTLHMAGAARCKVLFLISVHRVTQTIAPAQSTEVTCGKPLKCREPAAMMKDHTIFCSTGLVMTGGTLNHHAEPGAIIHNVGISPPPPNRDAAAYCEIWHNEWRSRPRPNKKLGPPPGQVPVSLLIQLLMQHSLLQSRNRRV